jgi:predicted phosphatase
MSDEEFRRLYQDPRWHEKRARIVSASGNACSRCGSKDRVLNVHHLFYFRNAQPWDYPDDMLRCLCVTCHGEVQENVKEIQRVFASMTRDHELLAMKLVRAVGDFCASPIELGPEIPKRVAWCSVDEFRSEP